MREEPEEEEHNSPSDPTAVGWKMSRVDGQTCHGKTGEGTPAAGGSRGLDVPKASGQASRPVPTRSPTVLNSCGRGQKRVSYDKDTCKAYLMR